MKQPLGEYVFFQPPFSYANLSISKNSEIGKIPSREITVSGKMIWTFSIGGICDRSQEGNSSVCQTEDFMKSFSQMLGIISSPKQSGVS